MSKQPLHVGKHSTLDAPPRPLIGFDRSTRDSRESRFGDDVWIGSHCILSAGITLGDGVIVCDGSLIECGVSIGARTLVTYRAQICEEASIAENCVIGGYIGERTVVKEHSRVFGKIVHHHIDPTLAWDAPSSMEPGAIIHEQVMIGFGALITNAVSIGPRAYVCAGATVSRDVPPLHIAYGTNQICSASEWRGPLRESPLFKVG